jgi:hypothetical protein
MSIASQAAADPKQVGYLVQGTLKVVGRDGSEGEINAGDGEGDHSR